jgi:hypothetical protein
MKTRIFFALIIVISIIGMANILPDQPSALSQYPGPETSTPAPTPTGEVYPIIHETNNLYPFWDEYTCWPDGFRMMVGTWRNMPAGYVPDLSDPVGSFTVAEGSTHYGRPLWIDVDNGGWDSINRTLHFWGWYYINDPIYNLSYTINGSINYNTTYQDILPRDYHPPCYSGIWIPLITIP